MHAGHGARQSTSSTNGHSGNAGVTNGSSAAKSRTDGHSTDLVAGTTTDRSAFTNGLKQTYKGHQKQEVVRLVIQSLKEMGYESSAATLEAESGVEIESPSVVALRCAVLDGEFSDAEMLLLGRVKPSSHSRNGTSGSNIQNGHDQSPGLPLRHDTNRDDLRILIRVQKYLELLEQHDHARALVVLREEIAPLGPHKATLHKLSGFMMCPTTDDLKKQAAWKGASGGSRDDLLERLSTEIHHSVIVPPSRLANLLSQVQKAWIGNCTWHNPVEPISLFTDHACDRDQFPLHAMRTLHHNDEIYHVAFSHDGRWLAASGRDKATIVYEVGGEWEEKYRFGDHQDEVGFGAWSPDDTMFITCSRDKSARLWSMSDGSCMATLSQFTECVTGVAWLPDGSAFVTGTLEIRNPLLLWKLEDVLGRSSRPAATLPAKEFRVQDVAVTPDGQRLIAVAAHPTNAHLSFFDLQSPGYEERWRMKFEANITCLSVSQDSRFVFFNTTDCKIQCVDIPSMEVVQSYSGQQQGTYVIRNCLGGADENLVISGSEDGKIYVFHRERGNLIETLPGHRTPGRDVASCVNAVAWNSADQCMFASCGDDGTIRIWSKSNAFTPATTRRPSDASVHQGTTGSRPASEMYPSAR